VCTVWYSVLYLTCFGFIVTDPDGSSDELLVRVTWAFKSQTSHQLTQAEEALEFQVDRGPSGKTIQDTGLVICSSYSSCSWSFQDQTYSPAENVPNLLDLQTETLSDETERVLKQ